MFHITAFAEGSALTCRWCDDSATGLRASAGLCDRHSFPEDRPTHQPTQPVESAEGRQS